MGNLAADRPAWWRWAYLGLWQSSSQLQMISPILTRWRWAYLGSAMLKPAKSFIVRPLQYYLHEKTSNKKAENGRTLSSGAEWTVRWTWALIPYSILPLSLISRTVSVDVKHHGRRSRRTTELRSCVNREVGLGSYSLSHSSAPPFLISPTVSVNVKHHERKRSGRTPLLISSENTSSSTPPPLQYFSKYICWAILIVFFCAQCE